MEELNDNYNVIEDAELVADSRIKQRDSFIDATTYQVSRALIDKEIDLDGANRVMEEVGNKYPLSLEEMAQMINKVHTANHLGCVEEKTETPTDAKDWSTLLARLNPKYTIFTDEDGDVSLGMTRAE